MVNSQSVSLATKKTSAGIKKGEIINFNDATKVTHAAPLRQNVPLASTLMQYTFRRLVVIF